MKERLLLVFLTALLQGCLFSRNVTVRPSHGGGEYRLTFRNAQTGEPALGYGYSIETGQIQTLAMVGTSYSGGPLDLQGSTEWTLENDPSRTWTVRLEPPHSPGTGLRRQKAYTFNLNRVFRNAGSRWPQSFRVRDERTGKWELVAVRIGPARY